MIFDAHVHCGLTLKYENVKQEWDKANIDGGVLFSPVEEIYNRYDPSFTDSEYYIDSRSKVHKYLCKLKKSNSNLFIYYFVWNDFKLPDNNFSGIKWHRHANEPIYNYSSDECKEFIDFICKKKLPVIIEEEFSNCINFIKLINGRTSIIIPHLGFLNGGYEQLKAEGIFAEDNIYADSALADEYEIVDFCKNFGVNKLFFGSDYPFGSPYFELQKIKKLFSGKDFSMITIENIKKLLSQCSNQSASVK